MSENRLKESNATLSFSGVGADTKELVFEPGVYDEILVHVGYTVTDAGISAGETFQGCIDRLSFGEGNNLPIDVRRNEVEALVTFMARNFVTGAFQDEMPTSATLQHVFYNFKGPFVFTGMTNPKMTLALKAITDEFGGATAFTATVNVAMIKSVDQTAYGNYYHRESLATNTRHAMNLGPSLVKDILVKGTTTSYASRIYTNATPQGYDGVDIDYPILLNANYCAKVNVSASSAAGAFLLEGCNIPWNSSRQIIVENSTTDTCLMFARNIVSK